MKRHTIIYSLICIFVIVCFHKSTAQHTNVVNNKTQIKIKAPKLKTSLGIFSDSVNITVDKAKAILATSLKVTDEKNTALTITYYQLLYKQNVTTENEETGKISPVQKFTSEIFRSTPLPPGWVNRIREDLTAGEELYFFDIIAKDEQGHIFYAPNLKIITQ